MTTARTIVERALKRARLLNATENASAADLSDGLDALNEMMFAWKGKGVDVAHQALAASDTFLFFVPPAAMASGVLASLAYQGLWNATTNTPTLSSGTGTTGTLYKVSVAGTTSLDGMASWAINDFAIFDGTVWREGQSSVPYEGAVVAMLGQRLAEENGSQSGPVLTRDAADGWINIMAQFVRPDQAIYDGAIVRTPMRRQWVN